MSAAGVPAPDRRIRVPPFLWPWLGLALGLVLTGSVWLLVRQGEKARLTDLRNAQATAVVQRLEGRLRVFGEILKGAAGYLGRGPLPGRSDWQGYVGGLDLPAAYPGIQGMGFVEWIPRAGQAAHVQRLRKEGFPDYALRPAGPLDPDPEGCGSVIYLEPADARNQRAFALDLLREPVRREALLRARDTGLTTLSGPITLFQETSTDIQSGALLLAPVYQANLPRGTVAERRQALRGWAYFPLRMGDLLRASLARELRQMDLRLADITGGGGPRPLFDSDANATELSAWTVPTRPIEVAGRIWQARVQPNAAFFREAGQSHHLEILAGGLAVSLLLFTLLMVLQGAEARARRLARRRGEELLATEAQFRALFELAPFGMSIMDSDSGRFLSVNARLSAILGYTASELEGRGFQSVTHPDHLKVDLDSVTELVSGAREVRKEKRYLHRDGHEVWARLSMVRLPSAPGAPARHLSIVEDITEARRRGEELKASETRFRGLFDLSPDPITLSRLSDGTLVMANQAWCEATGIPTEDALGHSPAGLGTWSQPQEREVLLEELRRKGRIVARPSLIRGRDGRVRQELITAQILTIGQEELVLIMGKDVTEQHQAQAALRSSEARYHRLFDHSPDGVVLIRLRDQVLLEVNQTWERMTGVPRAEALGQTTLELGLYGDTTERTRVYENLPDLGTSGVWPMALRRRDGSAFKAEVTVNVLEAEGERCVLVVLRDVTERQRAEENLAASEERFRAIFELSPDPITLSRLADGMVVMANKAWCDLTGFHLEEAQDHSAADLDPWVRHEARRTLVADLRRHGSVPPRLSTYLNRDGSECDLLITAKVLPLGGEELALIIGKDVTAQQRVQAALRSSESRWKLALEAAGDGVWEWTHGAATMYFSPRYKAMLGFEVDDEFGESFEQWIERIQPEDRAAVLLEVNAYLDGQRPFYKTEYRLQRRDGSYLWVLTRGAALERDAAGRPMRVIGTHTDITLRKEVELALQLSESRLRVLGDQLPDSFLFQLVADAEGRSRFVYLSTGVERLCGVQAEAVLRDPGQLFTQMDPQTLQDYLAQEAACAESLEPFAMDLRIRRADGHWRWFRVRSMPRHQPDGSLLWEGIATDVTDEVRGQAALAESEARFRHLADTAPALIWMADAAGRCTYFNAGWTAWTGQPAEEAQDEAWADFIHPEDLPGCLELSSRAFQAREPYSLEFRLRQADGTYRWLSDHAQPRLAENGTFLGYIGAGIDIQEMKEAEAASRDSEHRAKKAESLVLMAGGIAHDFNNIFQGTLGFLDIADAKATENAALGLVLAKAKASLRKAIQLSWKMLDFSGRGLLKSEPLDLERWLPAFLATLQLDLPPAIQLLLSADPVPSIQADRFKLEEVVKAIIDNAVEALGSGGGLIRLRLRADFGEDHAGPGSPGVWPLTRPAGPATVCLELADDGPGVPQERLPLICDPFFTTREQGRGLGLAVVVGILGGHRAGLHIFNGEGRGLVHRIHFPPSGL